MNKLHLLVIDDEPQIRRLLERGLSSYGYTVVSAPNGQDGIALAAQIKPAAIILDMDLRSIPDGVGVCKAVREWSAIPILILSVADSKTIKLAALNAGADDYITKPFDMDELEARIRAVGFDVALPLACVLPCARMSGAAADPLALALVGPVTLHLAGIAGEGRANHPSRGKQATDRGGHDHRIFRLLVHRCSSSSVRCAHGSIQRSTSRTVRPSAAPARTKSRAYG